MANQLAEKLASEYVRLIDEGWEPDLEEFLGRVPRELREPCREQIADLTRIAEECVQPAEEPESLEFTFFDEEQPQPEAHVEAVAEEVVAVEPEPEVIDEVVEEMPEPAPVEEVVAAEMPVEEPVEPEPEVIVEELPEPAPVEEVAPVEERAEPVVPEPVEEVVAAEAPPEEPEEPAEPEGPQRLTKEQAMAMWDSQRSRS